MTPTMGTSKRATPHVCPACSQKAETFYGKLVFAGEEVPTCPNHAADSPVSLVPSAAAAASTGGSSADPCGCTAEVSCHVLRGRRG